MDKKKCKYCKTTFNIKEWHTEEEKEMCFSCRCLEGIIKSLAISISIINIYNQKSKDYWAQKINSILNS